MIANRAPLILTLTMLTEATWLFSAIVVAGLIMDLPGGSVALPVVLLAIGHADPVRFPWAAIALHFRVLVGVIALYLVIAS